MQILEAELNLAAIIIQTCPTLISLSTTFRHAENMLGVVPKLDSSICGGSQHLLVGRMMGGP